VCGSLEHIVQTGFSLSKNKWFCESRIQEFV